MEKWRRPTRRVTASSGFFLVSQGPMITMSDAGPTGHWCTSHRPAPLALGSMAYDLADVGLCSTAAAGHPSCGAVRGWKGAALCFPAASAAIDQKAAALRSISRGRETTPGTADHLRAVGQASGLDGRKRLAQPAALAGTSPD
jgi:hypothetical protein